MKTTFEQELNQKGKLIYTNVGDSMLPLIRQDKDLMIIERPSGRLKKYDVPLYKRDNGQYVLHRILKVRETDYIICGDNRWQKEYGITDRQIIGVLTGIVRNKKMISVENKMYLLYVHLWCDFFPVRAVMLRILLTLKRKVRTRKHEI